MIELQTGTADQKLILILFYSSDLAWTRWKMIDLHPSTADQNITLILFKFRFRLDMVKDDWLPLR